MTNFLIYKWFNLEDLHFVVHKNSIDDSLFLDLLGDFGGEEVISNVNTTAQADTSGQKASDRPPPKAATSFFLLDFGKYVYILKIN